MKSEIDIFKVIEENGFNIKQIVEKLLEKDNMIEQLLEKIEELKEAALSGTTQADTMQVTKTAEQEFDEVMQKHEQ